jgi:hypothetical protein
MHNPISKPTRTELLEALRQPYQQTTRSEKTKVLDEFVALAGCHRKHAIRLLTAARPVAAPAPRPARRLYESRRRNR